MRMKNFFEEDYRHRPFDVAFAGFAVAEKAEISYMCWYNTTQSEAQGIQATIDKFNASQDRIHVTMIAIPRDGYETKVNTMAAAGQLPDCTRALGGHGDPVRRRRPPRRRQHDVSRRRRSAQVPDLHLQGQAGRLQLG